MIALIQVMAMQEDKAMAAKWMTENVDLVLKDLNKLHNISIDMAIIYSLLTDDRKGTLPERVEKVVQLLLEMAKSIPE